MAKKYVDLNNLRFWMNEVHKIHDLYKYERYQDYDKDAVNILINAIKDLADKEFFPFFTDMDTQGVSFKDGKVTVHPQVENIIKASVNLGWIGPTFDYEHGGMQLPESVYLACNHILEAANNSGTGYLALTSGSARLITSFGSQELIDTYVPNMLAGKWMGSMALTEPQAGSSLSDISTSAKPNDDGSYNIKGQKIFISGGDHQFAENFVHLTLARIDGAPAGTKGISLFVTPQHRPTNEGLTFNDVIVGGDFQKMGQKGYCTTHLIYGENDGCKGWLVGTANQGLKYMFQMMNEARIDVGATAASTATAAYYASLQYANEREQGSKLPSDAHEKVDKKSIGIINHPDVRRMLLLQSAITEGAMSLIMNCTKYADLYKVTGDEKYHLLLEILTPIAKTYPSERGQYSISNGLQVLGGYGFTIDFPLQQYYRDIRIMSLYEGTTGIQSLDLLGRKSTMHNGKAIELLGGEILKTMQEGIELPELKPYASLLGKKLGLVQNALHHLLKFAQKGNYELFLADANTYMEMLSTLTIAWQWMQLAIVAQNAINNGDGEHTLDFYKKKIHTMRFYYKYELPIIDKSVQIIMHDEHLTSPKDGDIF